MGCSSEQGNGSELLFPLNGYADVGRKDLFEPTEVCPSNVTTDNFWTTVRAKDLIMFLKSGVCTVGCLVVLLADSSPCDFFDGEAHAEDRLVLNAAVHCVGEFRLH